LEIECVQRMRKNSCSMDSTSNYFVEKGDRSMKKILRRLVTAMISAAIMLSSVSVFAAQQPKPNAPQLPQSIIKDGKVFERDVTAGGGNGTATPDNPAAMSRAYTVTGSEVWLYVDYSNGHGGDHFAYGYVQATAPSFTARAEVWANGKMVVTGPNIRNSGNIAYATSSSAVGLVNNAYPRIFYAW